MRVRHFLAAVAVLSALFVAAPSVRAAGCILVAGGGPGSGPADSQANADWNRLNFAFFDATLTAVEAMSKVEQAFFTAQSFDEQESARSLLAQATRAGCATLLIVNVHADATRPESELVFSIRASHLEARTGQNPQLSRPDYEREYRFATTPEALAKAVPTRIGEQAVREYFSSRKR